MGHSLLIRPDHGHRQGQLSTVVRIERSAIRVLRRTNPGPPDFAALHPGYALDALPRAGFPRLSPAEGAFYLFADVTERTNDSAAFCAGMLAEIDVTATPGVDFDGARGNRFMRFSYCGPEPDLREAAERLAQWR